MNPIKLSSLFCFCALAIQAQLEVTVSPVKLTGQKAVVMLAMTNNLAAPVESARAVCFLLDGQGRMIGQSSKWVIGGTKDRPALQPKAGTTFNFVITSPRPFATTNLTSKESFSRVVLTGQKLANPQTDVKIQTAN
jgi:hypothetical protein